MSCSRRGFVEWASGAALVAPLRTGVQQPEQRDLFALEQLAGGVWFAFAWPATMVNCNAAIFEQQDGLVLVDTHSKPSAAEALLAQISRDVSPKPIRYVVYTHFHFDHVQGTPAVRKKWPGVTVVASEATRRLLDENAAQWLRMTLTSSENTIKSAGEQEAAAKTPEEAARWRRRREDSEGYIAEMKGNLPVAPDLSFERELILHDKLQTLHLKFFGRGHTGGDTVVWSPSRKVVATGDLAHAGMAYAGDCYPREWGKTLQALAELDFDRLAGGHGPAATKQCVLDRRAYIDELTAAVARAKQEGTPLEQLQASLTPSRLSSMSSGMGERIAAILRAQPGAPSDPAAAIAATVKSNLAHVWQRLDVK
jgi:glyoxylase-like metal-dependent hydrolase (beta-lactamase superfamily II)